jgi:hypothetical protein
VIDDQPLVGFALIDEHILLDLRLYGRDGKQLLNISRSQLIYSVDPWDIELVGRDLKIRVQSRDIVVHLGFEPPTRLLVNRGRFTHNQVEVLVKPDYLLVVNNEAIFRGCEWEECPVGVAIGGMGRGGAAVSLKGVERPGVSPEGVEAWADRLSNEDALD